MKVSPQVVHADLHEKTFTESLILSVKSMLEQRHLELSYKKVLWTCKKHENHKTLMVYGIHTNTHMHARTNTHKHTEYNMVV